MPARSTCATRRVPTAGAPPWRTSWTACPVCSRARRCARCATRSCAVRARGGSPLVWGIGRARRQGGPLAGGHRPHGARLRHGHRAQRRRASCTTSSWRSPGSTSEDVAAGLDSGAFGMARETGEEINRAIVEGDRDGLGLGGGHRPLPDRPRPRPRHVDVSLLAAAWRLASRPPSTSPWARTSSTCTRPAIRRPSGARPTSTSGSSRAQAARLGGGGVYLNVGSAVVLPEVFLKAVTLARNLGHRLRRLRHRQPGLHPVLPPRCQRGPAARRRQRPRVQDHRTPRDPGPPARRRPRRT